MGFKVPKGYGIFTNPKKAIYNKIYRKTTVGAEQILSKGKRSTVNKSEKVRRTSNDLEMFGKSNNAVKDHISKMAKDYEDIA